MPQVTYTPAQLAPLAQKYHFKWNAASYFVISFAAVVAAIMLAFVSHHIFGIYTRRHNKAKNGSIRDGESYLIAGHHRLRPNSRIVAALRKGKISNPVPSEPSESGHSYKGAASGEGGEYDEGRERYQAV